ncbi:MAG: DUF1223 domain-containing protein [Burkholderiaceae bacterium]
MPSPPPMPPAGPLPKPSPAPRRSSTLLLSRLPATSWPAPAIRPERRPSVSSRRNHAKRPSRRACSQLVGTFDGPPLAHIGHACSAGRPVSIRRRRTQSHVQQPESCRDGLCACSLRPCGHSPAVSQPACRTAKPAARRIGSRWSSCIPQGCSSVRRPDRDDRRRHPDWPTSRRSHVVPLSLHVGYWDYIGWKDPYALERSTRRQRSWALRHRASTVYTPQVVVDGKDFRAWRDPERFLDAVESANAQAARVSRRLGASAHGDGSVRIVAQAAPRLDGEIFMALVQDAASDQVARGENAGRRLSHRRVVRALLGPFDSARSPATSDVRLPGASAPEGFGVAAWVQSSDGEILQAIQCRLR